MRSTTPEEFVFRAYVSKRWSVAATNLKIRLGGFVFIISPEDCDAWISSELSRRWHHFKAAGVDTDVAVRVTCYTPQRTYDWPPEVRVPFADAYEQVLDRYPFNNGQQGTGITPMDILDRLDPNSQKVRNISRYLAENKKVIFANTDTGIFFFLPTERTLHIFTPTPPRPFPILSRLYRLRSQARATLVADISNGIMLAASWLLAHEGGLLLHGTGVSRSDTALLFLGLSGAGKSTIARGCGADACYSDDGAVVKKAANAFWIQPSIFTQVPSYWRQTPPLPMELRGLLLLNKATDNRVIPLDKNRLANDILLHLIHFFRYFDRKTAKQAFENVLSLVGSLPAYRFDFTKNREKWSDIWQVAEKRKNTNRR